MPYNWKVIKKIVFDKTFKEGAKSCQTERDLQILFKNYKYLPLKKFEGMYESFTNVFQVNLKH
jgi:hypothetical protein